MRGGYGRLPQGFVRLETGGMATLPVVDSQRGFVGMVERTRLVASPIVDVVEKLEALSSFPK